MPKGWNDLLNPVYKGALIMPKPAKLTVAGEYAVCTSFAFVYFH